MVGSRTLNPSIWVRIPVLQRISHLSKFMVVLRIGTAVGLKTRSPNGFVGSSPTTTTIIRQFMPRKNQSKIYSITDEQIVEVVSNSRSLRQVAKTLNLSGNTAYCVLRERIKILGLYSKFESSQFWNRGKNHLSDERIKSSIPDDKFFSKRSHLTTDRAKKLFISTLSEEQIRCSCCKLTTWCEQKLPLELDHINGDNRDNTVENLRLLCPNCHSLTPTWRGRNSKGAKKKVSDEELLLALKEEKSVNAALKRVGLAGAGNYGRCYQLLITSQGLLGLIV